MSRIYGIPGPHDYDHDPEESQPLGPPLRAKKEEQKEIWTKDKEKPGFETNQKGEKRYTPSTLPTAIKNTPFYKTQETSQ